MLLVICLPLLVPNFGDHPLGLLCLLDILQAGTTNCCQNLDLVQRKKGAYSKPRSTSGIAVNIVMLLVTLPSSFSLSVLGFVLQRPEAALKSSSWGSRGFSSSGSCSRGRLRTFRFSSMYAILKDEQSDTRGWREDIHVLVHVQGIRLLGKVVLSHCTSSFGSFGLFVGSRGVSH